MWKFIARGIRETFERRICRTNIYSQSSQDNTKNEMKVNLVRQQKFLPPVLITCDKSFCGSAKNADTEDKEHNSKWNTKHNWTEAVGWSSALAAGWVVCQTLCLHKRLLDRDNKISVETLKDKLFNCTGISQLLLQLSNLQPKHIFPVTNCVGNNSKKSNELESNAQWTVEKPFGPVTIEEEFETIANEFANINKIIIGRYELHCGIKALGKKRYKDALMHFTAGAKMSSPRSMFNLGLCYELGIGTIMDQSKAVEHYNNAARYDHADALYNLGVYHAQGRGGLPINIDIARNYFIKAAKLGQVQAKHALDLEKAEKLTKTSNIVLDTCKLEKDIDLRKNEANTQVKLTNYALNTNPDCALSADFAKSTYQSNENIVAKYDEKIEDDVFTDAFLDLLSLGKPRQTSIKINVSNCDVAC